MLTHCSISGHQVAVEGRAWVMAHSHQMVLAFSDSTLALLGDCKRTEGLLKMASATLHPTDERSKTTVGVWGGCQTAVGAGALISQL